jgi:hypothetical protein
VGRSARGGREIKKKEVAETGKGRKYKFTLKT